MHLGSLEITQEARAVALLRFCALQASGVRPLLDIRTLNVNEFLTFALTKKHLVKPPKFS